jgi:hypothetical protein
MNLGSLGVFAPCDLLCVAMADPCGSFGREEKAPEIKDA